MQLLTESKLYNYIQCKHSVWRDVYGPQDTKIAEDNQFVNLLWERVVVPQENAINEFVRNHFVGADNMVYGCKKNNQE